MVCICIVMLVILLPFLTSASSKFSDIAFTNGVGHSCGQSRVISNQISYMVFS